MLCRRYIVIQEMVVAAALEQDREKAVQALLLDPMIRDLDDGRAMAGELLEAQKEWITLEK
jgi:alpha-galactosidase/6-phospho-beta-glucosidase family protein